MRRTLLIVASATACAMPTSAPLHFAPAPASEYASFDRPGAATLTGQAFLSTRGGETRRAAGSGVTLDPLTSYSRAWCLRVCDERGIIPGEFADSVALRHRRETKADADGRFTFTNVPAGQYIVRTGVTWQVGYALQGGMMAELVTVPDGGTVNVIMSRRDNPLTRSPQ